MSMENDTRLAMMALQNGSQNAPLRIVRKNTRRPLILSGVAAMAAFALTLFTRGV
ncbi:hypothetical protein SYK_23300 [Pseudodesulfovibrio nedwellii]|uniref:Uncharacterized protein n=1 Tax=Pseudodesulfovibrio nedwellii TaxID=2973072 RepID=A0ABM8B2C1_9BACT|nr:MULTISPECIES: hypothetical protein [Pseudodesulfovibrio]BDQ37970.1 hypothetical protein SYK_23300 [Pseudodesulfovibrio nedwellii]